MHGRLGTILAALGAAAALAACAAPAAGGEGRRIFVDDVDQWQVASFCGNPGDERFIQGPRDEGGAAGFLVFDSRGNAYVACGTFVLLVPGDEGPMRVISGTPGVSGHADGPPWKTAYTGLTDIALGDDDTLYVLDGADFTVRRLRKTENGQWHSETYAGVSGKSGHKDGPAAEALFSAPLDSIAVDPKGVVHVFGGDWLRRIEGGQVKTLNAGTGRRDGPLAQAQFSRIMGAGHCMSFDEDGNLYVADRWNMAIRKVDFKAGEVSTVAGRAPGAETGPAPRDGPALDARFHAGGGPCTLFYNPVHKCLLVISADESVTRWIKDGWVKTLGPGGNKKKAPAFGPARSAAGGGPCGVDRQGNVYVFGGGGIRVMRKKEAGQ